MCKARGEIHILTNNRHITSAKKRCDFRILVLGGRLSKWYLLTYGLEATCEHNPHLHPHMIIWIYHHRIYKLFFLSSQKSVISVTVFSWRTFAQCRVNSLTLILKCANIDLMDRKWKRGVDENLKLWQKLSVCEIVEHGKLCGCRCRQEVEPKRRWAGTDNRGGAIGMEGAFLRGKTPFLDDYNYVSLKESDCRA